MYFNVSSANLKENKRNLKIQCTSIYVGYKTYCRIIELSDSRAAGLGIGSPFIWGNVILYFLPRQRGDRNEKEKLVYSVERSQVSTSSLLIFEISCTKRLLFVS